MALCRILHILSIGSDYEFASHALKAGHQVYVMSFEGHKEYLPKLSPEIQKLTTQVLKTADPYLKTANKKLERSLSGNAYVMNLLRRNYFQIKSVSSVYAVGDFLDSGKKDSVRVSGGTAWACQMFIDKMVDEDKEDIHKVGLFFFSQKDGSWFQCSLTKDQVSWDKIDKPPKPKGKYAGIGTRELTPKGRETIKAF